ncbi:MAG: hypothetical protein J6Q35_07675 [Rikenellaceae bacterium]|nr:hypothetical protein [Rikenellaceae bacterium]
MKGEIVKMWVIIDSVTGEELREFDEYRLAKTCQRLYFPKDILRWGLCYIEGDYCSTLYFGNTIAEAKRKLKECESVK